MASGADGDCPDLRPAEVERRDLLLEHFPLQAPDAASPDFRRQGGHPAQDIALDVPHRQPVRTRRGREAKDLQGFAGPFHCPDFPQKALKKIQPIILDLDLPIAVVAGPG